MTCRIPCVKDVWSFLDLGPLPYSAQKYLLDGGGSFSGGETVVHKNA